MLLQAAQENHLKLENCIVIGDRWSDMVAADHAGCKKILVKTGAGLDALGPFRHKWSSITPDYVAENLKDAVNWIYINLEDK